MLNLSNEEGIFTGDVQFFVGFTPLEKEKKEAPTGISSSVLKSPKATPLMDGYILNALEF